MDMLKLGYVFLTAVMVSACSLESDVESDGEEEVVRAENALTGKSRNGASINVQKSKYEKQIWISAQCSWKDDRITSLYIHYEGGGETIVRIDNRQDASRWVFLLDNAKKVREHDEISRVGVKCRVNDGVSVKNPF